MYSALKELEYEDESPFVPVEESGPAPSKSDEIGPPDPASVEQEAHQSDQILRFQKSERVLHWSIAVPFMVCYATGMVLMLFFNLNSGGISRQILSWIHRIAGTAMIIFPALTAVRHWKEYRVHLYNIKHAWSWKAADLKWLALMLPASVCRRIELPDQGKFNAAEKVNFLMVLCTYPLFIATGLLVWIPGSGILFWLVHVGMALIATPLMLGHIFMALVNPGTRVGLSGMISGYVDRHWAKHHYRLWYRENFEEDARESGEEKSAIHPFPRNRFVVLRFATPRRPRNGKPAGISIQALPAEQHRIGARQGEGSGSR